MLKSEEYIKSSKYWYEESKHISRDTEDEVEKCQWMNNVKSYLDLQLIIQNGLMIREVNISVDTTKLIS
jgi:hypothetical protein